MAPGPAGFAELLGGVDGDPDPSPTIIYSPVSSLARTPPDPGATAPEPTADVPPEPPAPDLTWQQLVDAHRADFGLGPRAAS